MKLELKRWLYTCDGCDGKAIVEGGPIPSLPQDWLSLHVVIDDDRTISQDICPTCLVPCSFCNGEGRTPRADSTITNANMRICNGCDGKGVMAKHDRRVGVVRIS